MLLTHFCAPWIPSGLAALLFLGLSSQDPADPADPAGPTAPAATESAAAEPTIDDFAWLAGHWRGTGLGGECEEVWSEPLAGTMMGTFKLVRDGEIVFYEIMVLGADDEGIALKVKHFSKEFVAWEDKTGCVRFALESVEENEAKFSGLTMARDGDALELKLRMRAGDGSTSWQPFAMRRHVVGGAAKEPGDRKKRGK